MSKQLLVLLSAVFTFHAIGFSVVNDKSVASNVVWAALVAVMLLAYVFAYRRLSPESRSD